MSTTASLDAVKQRLAGMLVEDAASQQYRLQPQRIFTDDEALFDLEMKHIFEGNWIYLAHESQIPNANDYFTTQIGRQPIVITRNKAGQLNAIINACSHRGATLCRHKKGNKPSFTCTFHGWTFNNSGKLLKVKDANGAGYPDNFNKDGSHDLKKVARFESYRGFLFGSLNADVPPLVEFLGESTKIIDMIVDQSPDGLEVLRGSSTYTFDGNWKLQTENGADGYHVSSVHWNYAATTNQRKQAAAGDTIKAMDAGSWAKNGGGFYCVRARPHAAVDQVGQPRGPAGLPDPRPAGRAVRPGPGRLDDRPLAQPVPVPQRLPDGPVQLADPRAAADQRRQDRGHHLLHRTQGRERPRRVRAASASTRTSSTPPAWPRPMTWRSSAPASRATTASRWNGTTCAAAPSSG